MCMKNDTVMQSQAASGGTVLIGGDTCPIGRNTPYFADGDAVTLFGDLLDEFERADLSVVNLECPLTDADTPMAKSGPTLRAPSRCVAAIKNAGIGVLNLANNHILDHGPAGLESTLRVVEAAGIATAGAGRNRDEARRILIRDAGGVRIGILGVAEHEFSIATASSPGANPLDLIDIVRNITAHKKEWDYLIVLLHGGNEGYPLPSPRLMDTCRFLVEQGAKAVICQHSHCVGCYEDYCGGHIVYGQGNFVFDSSAPPSGWNEGVLVRLCLSEKSASRMELVPFEQSGEQPGARKKTPDAARATLNAMTQRSERIQDATFVQEQWRQFCRNAEHYYLSTVLGHGPLLGRLNRYGHVVRYLLSKKALLGVQNVVRCEAHREVLETIFEQFSPRS